MIDLRKIRRDIVDYACSFRVGSRDDIEQINMKIRHTVRVASEVKRQTQSCPRKFSEIAILSALLHDIGRFQQYKTFHTYDDRVSINHGALGVVVVDQLGMLANLDVEIVKAVKNVIMYHNSEEKPHLNEVENGVLDIVRDADKLDIWGVILKQDAEKPIVQEYTREIFNYLVRNESIPYRGLVTKTDIRMFRLSWIFDVRRSETIKEMQKRGYAERMMAKLPETDDFNELRGSIRRYINAKVAQK